MNQQLEQFYKNRFRQCSPSLGVMLNMSDTEFEQRHDFIQWMFPTETPSQFNPDAPVLDDETITALKASASFNNNFRDSLCRFFEFLGLNYLVEWDDVTKTYQFTFTGVFEQTDWLVAHNHNLLRLGRVLESCKLLGYEKTAISLFELLLNLAKGFPDAINTTNIWYWYRSTFKKA